MDSLCQRDKPIPEPCTETLKKISSEEVKEGEVNDEIDFRDAILDLAIQAEEFEIAAFIRDLVKNPKPTSD